MKHLQSYNNFNKVNEELTSSEKRSIRFIPQAILGFLGKKLLGIYPMLNLRWREMKRATTGLKDSPFSTGDQQVMKHELTKVSIDDLPENKLKLAMLLRDWNLYLAKDYKSTGGGEHGKIGRDVIYISKDEIKLGDTYRGQRLSDSDIYPVENFIMKKNSKGTYYPDKLKDPANFPMIIMIAKYDELEKVKEVQQLVDDICLELEDELPVDVKPYFSKEQDYLSLDVKVGESRNLVYSNDVDSLLNDVAERIKDYLKEEKYNFNYIIKYKVKGPLFYNGRNGRFGDEIIEAAKEYSSRYDEDTDKPLWSRYYQTLNVEKLSMSYASNDKLVLTGSDLDTLLSDLDNCTKSWSLNLDLKVNRNSEFPSPTVQNGLKERNKVTEIKLKQVSIVFKKVK
jgi:hypothetical protein